MTRQEAINWCDSKIGQYLDFDKQFNTQCVDFFNYYYQFLTGLNPYDQGLGVDYAYQLASKRPAGLTWVQNNPADKNQLPSDGDIIIMSGANGFGDGAGHVLTSQNTDANAVRGIDETPNTKVAARQYSWTNVLGWFVPDQFMQSNPPQGGSDMAEKITVDTSRILTHGIQAKNGLIGRPDSLDGSNGGDAFVGQDLSNALVQQVFLSPEGRQWRDSNDDNSINGINRTLGQLSDAQKAASDAEAKASDLTTKNVDLSTKLDDIRAADAKEISDLKQQLAEAQANPAPVPAPPVVAPPVVVDKPLSDYTVGELLGTALRKLMGVK